MTEIGNIAVLTYKGSQGEAMKLFQDDVPGMAAKGFAPTSQSYAAGTYGCGSFIVALLLCFILIGFLVFIYMLIVKPPGVLTVTFERKADREQAPAATVAEKTCPRCAERVKAAAKVCRFCNHEFA